MCSILYSSGDTQRCCGYSSFVGFFRISVFFVTLHVICYFCYQSVGLKSQSVIVQLSISIFVLIFGWCYFGSLFGAYVDNLGPLNEFHHKIFFVGVFLFLLTLVGLFWLTQSFCLSDISFPNILLSSVHLNVKDIDYRFCTFWLVTQSNCSFW